MPNQPLPTWTPCRYHPEQFDCGECDIGWDPCRLRTDESLRHEYASTAWRRAGLLTSVPEHDHSMEKRVVSFMEEHGVGLPPVLLHDYLQKDLPGKTTVDDLESLVKRSSRFHESSPGIFTLSSDSGQHISDIPLLPVSSGIQLEQMLHASAPLSRDEQTVLFKQLAGIQYVLSNGSPTLDRNTTETTIQKLSQWALLNRGWGPMEIYSFAVGHHVAPIAEWTGWVTKTNALLSAVSALEWVQRDESGDAETFLQQIIERLTLANCRLVASQARRLAQGRFLMYADLFQEGVLGLLKAIQRFDPYRGYQFSTYAVYWIQQAIQQAITTQDRFIRLPVHKHVEIRDFRVAAEELQNQFGREPTVREVALRLLEAESGKEDMVARLRGGDEQTTALDQKHLRRTEEKVKELQTYREQSPLRLDAFDDKESEQYELLSDDRTESPGEEALKQEVIDNVAEQVNKLPEPDRTVMRLLYGFDGEEPRKTSEIATMFNRDPDMLALLPSRQFTDSYVESIRKDAASLKASGDSSTTERPTELATKIMSLLAGTKGLAPRTPSKVAAMLNKDPDFRHPLSPKSYNTTRIRVIADRAISSLKNVKSVETLSLDT